MQLTHEIAWFRNRKNKVKIFSSRDLKIKIKACTLKSCDLYLFVSLFEALRRINSISVI